MKDLENFRKYRWYGALALAALLLIAWRTLHKPADAARAAPPAIAVDTAAAAHADVPIYLLGLGTVQAFYTVTVTARGRRRTAEGGIHRRSDRAQGGPARPDRSAPESGCVRTSRGHQGERCGAAGECPGGICSATPSCSPEDLASKQTVDTQHAMVDQLGAQLQVDQALIDNAHTQLDYTRITSPIDGRTGIRLVDPGNIVHGRQRHRHRGRNPGAAHIRRLHAARGGVCPRSPARRWPRVRSTSRPLSPRRGAPRLTMGTLTLIDNEIDQATGTAKLKAVFGNLHNTLWPGQYVNAPVLVRISRNALTLPHDRGFNSGPTGRSPMW